MDMGIPGFSYTSQKTNLTAQQNQNVNFNPQISIQSPDSTLTPSTTFPSSQSSNQNQADTPNFSMIPDNLSNWQGLFGGGQSVPLNTPNDTSILGSQQASASSLDPKIMILVGVSVLVFFWINK